MPNNNISKTNLQKSYVCVSDKTSVRQPIVEDYSNSRRIISPPKKLIISTSSGKTYDLKDVIKEKLNNLALPVYNGLQKTNPILDWCKKNIINGTTAKDVAQKILDLMDTIKISCSAEELFESSTGKKCTQENLDKFIKGELELKINSDFMKYFGKSAPKTSPAPDIPKSYLEEKNRSKNQGKVFKLSPKEQVKYNIVFNGLSTEYQKKLSKVLKLGKLTEDKSQKLTVLDSLHKIFTTQRIKGLDNVKLTQECIDILENPNIITQLAEDIPEKFLEDAAQRYYNSVDKRELNANTQNWLNKNKRTKTKNTNKPTINEKMEYIKDELRSRWALSTCAAASLEYDLATKRPAEFFKLVEKLTSNKDNNIEKTIYVEHEVPTNTTPPLILMRDDYPNQLENDLKDTQTIITEETISIKADTEAYYLARIQNNYKNKNERSMIDIIVQSMIMNLGTDDNYNSLTDLIYCDDDDFKLGNSGLYNYETSYAKGVLFNKNNELNIYSIELENGSIIKLQSKSSIKEELMEHLKKGENIVIGYIQKDHSIHEITIIGHTTNDNGEGFFICQDSCQEDAKPAIYSENFIISNIEHAIYEKDDIPLPPESIRKQKTNVTSSILNPLNPGYVIKQEGEYNVKGNKIITPWTK